MDQKEYPQSNLPEVAEKRPGEEGLVENVGEAHEKAQQVKELAGEKIDQEPQRLMAMRQFPGLGLEENINRALGNIKNLYEKAEQNIEGKQWADFIRNGFKLLEDGGYWYFTLNVFEAPKKENFEAFLGYLGRKFGPKLYSRSDVNQRYPDYYYLRIPQSEYVFQVKMAIDSDVIESGRLYKNDNSAFLEGLKPKPS